MKIDLVIAIVCYNSQEIIVKAINSINEDSLNIKIVILDNCSTDSTIDVISKLNDGRVILIESDKNIGFAGGCNQIFDFVIKNKLPCDYFLMFNPDAIAEENCLFRLIETFSIDSRIGIVSPRITFLNGKIWYTGAMINWKKLKINNNPSNPEDINIRETDVFSGCTAIIKADVLKNNGGLDANLFMYYDELEYSIKLKKKGYKIFYNPNVNIRHDVSSSTKEKSYISTYYLTRNYYYTFIRNEHYSLVVSYLIITINIFRNIISLIKKNKLKNVSYCFLGIFHFSINRTGKL